MNEYAVFLDVDGVINSLNHLYQSGDVKFSAATSRVRLNGYNVWIPNYMPNLIQSIYNSTDLYWLTTWRDDANKFISPELGIPKNIPVITDGSKISSVSWKFAACYDLAVELDRKGQQVIWIEDFAGHHSSILEKHLTYVDTDLYGEGVLLPQHLPTPLYNHIVQFGGYTGPEFVNKPRAYSKN